MMTRPTVSVIMPTYNHESFVGRAIESVLAQTGVDLELVVSDDGSSDGTREVIASIRDSRIRFFPNTVNRGACVVTNELVQAASGEFIAVLNSDDSWPAADKLAYQVGLMRERPELGATFGRARFVDRQGQPIPKESLPFGRVFDQENRSQGRWLRRFFDLGNCLCHPTVLIRRSCYDELGFYSNRLRQLPDFEMWVRLLKRHAVHVSDRELIDFRILEGDNASSITPDNAIRTINEHLLIAHTFFEGIRRDQLIDGFGDVLVCKDVPTEIHLDIEKVLQYFRPSDGLDKPYRLIGLLRMNTLLDSDRHRAVLQSDYAIDDRWFHRMMADVDVLRPRTSTVLSDGKVKAQNLWQRMRRQLKASG
jgi:hypothetical protein